MKRSVIIIFIILTVSIYAQTKEQHSYFTKVLQQYNHSGLIDYSNLKSDQLFLQYLKQLTNTNPDTLNTKNEKLAFWINAYNAFTIQRILKDYPIKSINELHRGGRYLSHFFSTTVWDESFIKINQKEYSLNDIEHNIIRKQYKDPRIHFALVCASISCPKLRNEAYESYKLDSQLDDQAFQFFNDTTRNKFDRKNKIAYLSKILDWYESDFAENDEEVFRFISKYLNADLSNNIKSDIAHWEIEYLDYNWELNDYK